MNIWYGEVYWLWVERVNGPVTVSFVATIMGEVLRYFLILRDYFAM